MGDKIVERLSAELAGEFGDKCGFSPFNLWRMRLFYLAYRDDVKLAQLVQVLP